MELPKAMDECDYDMCPSHEELDNSRDEPLQRCSVCKNQFYCSAACQKNDWKKHKWNCSPFPTDDTAPPATSIERDAVFLEAVAQVTAIVKGVHEKIESANAEKKKLSRSMLAPLLEIPEHIPPGLAYTRDSPEHEKFPYRAPLLTACRLLLVDTLATLDAPSLAALSASYTQMQTPSGWPQLHGPKVLARPADLSPGEYEMLARVTPVGLVPLVGAGEMPESLMRWMWLSALVQKVYNVGKAAEKPGAA